MLKNSIFLKKILRLNLSDYIQQLQSVEEFAFSRKELEQVSTKTKAATSSELSRMVEKGVILNLRKSFYLIVPPRYSRQGFIPVELYAEKLFKFLNRPYYLGFFSAAKFHGASHQQVHQDYIITERPKLRDIEKNGMRIRFFTTSNAANRNIEKIKSDAGIFRISSPALTAIDLIHHQSKIGGLNRVITVLEELIEEINLEDVSNLLTWYPHISSLQRLGYLLSQFEASDKLTRLIFQNLAGLNFYPVLLSPRSNQKPGRVNNPWKVDVNIKLESDL